MKRYRILTLSISVLVFLIFVYQFWDYSIDDAFITYRYAENLADGYGLTFNQGDKPVEGYSNFLWLLLLAVTYSIGLPTYVTAKLLGIVCILAAALVWFWNFNKSSTSLTWLAAPLFLITPVTAFWAVSGLELGLYSLILAGFSITIIKQSKWSLLFAPMIVLIRPEGIAIGFAILVAGWLADFKGSRNGKRFYLLNLVPLFLTVALLTVFRLEVFGYPMPNTFYAKATMSIFGFRVLVKMLLFFLPLTILFFYGLFTIVTEGRYEKRLVIFSLAFLSMAVINCLVSAVMNFHFRYMIAYLPFFFAVALWALSHIQRTRVYHVVLALAVVSLFVPTPSVYSRVEQEREINAAQMKLVDFIEKLPPDTRISLTDVGRIPYYTAARYYDIWGLLSEEIAHDGFNALREYLRFPDYFVFVGYLRDGRKILRFGTERMIVGNLGFSQAYQVVGACMPDGADISREGYYYLIFEKNQAAVDSLLRLYPAR